MNYYRTRISGLAVQVSPSDPENPIAPEVVRFQPVKERYQGDQVTVGYLATDDKRAIEILKTDGNVEVISKDDYNKAMGIKTKDAQDTEQA